MNYHDLHFRRLTSLLYFNHSYLTLLSMAPYARSPLTPFYYEGRMAIQRTAHWTGQLFVPFWNELNRYWLWRRLSQSVCERMTQMLLERRSQIKE